MRFWILVSSVSAILGGALFLVLPVGFLNGTVSIAYPDFYTCLQSLGQSANYYLACGPPPPIRPMPDYTALFLVLLGVVGVILGFLGLKLGPRPSLSVVLGLAVSLGSIAFLFWAAIPQILESFVVDPPFFLLFSELSIPVMTGAVIAIIYGLLRAAPSLQPVNEVTDPQRLRIRLASSRLVFSGGMLFLVLPVAFFSGSVSLSNPLGVYSGCGSYNCILPIFRPFTVPGEAVPLWASFGMIGILLGMLGPKLSLRPRSRVALGFVLCLASTALLFTMVTYYILETFFIAPVALLLVPMFSVVAMAVGALLLIYDLVWKGARLVHGLSSLMAILGSSLFLVLPAAFLKGAASINYVFTSEPQCTNPICPVAIIPMPNDTALYLIFLGMVGVLLGFLTLRLHSGPNPNVDRVSAVWFSFSLGIMTILFQVTVSKILGSYTTDPSFFLIFPELSVALMAGTTVLFLYEFLRARLSLPLVITEASVHG